MSDETRPATPAVGVNGDGPDGAAPDGLPDRIYFRDVQARLARQPAPRPRQRQGWWEERLGIGALYRKYGRKAFPVHSTFFFGEMAAFSFLILVLTGVYLGLIYAPSNVEITTASGDKLPEAYASVRLIESIPVANLFRNVHHWAAHLMVVSVLLHALRIFFYGTYRKPREINWLVGVALLGLTLLAAFVGYSLPYDAYSVTATGIGYSIARSVPWVGNVAADILFGGAFPTLGSLPRLYTVHVFIVPLLIMGLIGFHLLVVVKQKHTQPGYARALAEPGRVLGVPLWPYQALLAGQLLLLMFGVLFLMAALIPVHPLAAFGPPGPETPEVKPDWYLLWVYGFLKLVPASWVFTTPLGTIGPEFIGGVLFPGAVFLLMALAPWLDGTNRGNRRRVEYLEPPVQSPLRVTIGVTVLVVLGMLVVAAYDDSLGLNLAQMWTLSVAVPVAVAALLFGLLRRRQPAPGARFDPTGEDLDVDTPVAPSVGSARVGEAEQMTVRR